MLCANYCSSHELVGDFCTERQTVLIRKEEVGLLARSYTQLWSVIVKGSMTTDLYFIAFMVRLKHYVYIISFLEDFIQRGNTSCKLLQNNRENHRGKKCVITESLHLSLVFKAVVDCKQSLTFDTIEETTGNKGLRYTCIIPCH